MVARLVRVLGPAQFELAEDVVQEALVRALKLWPAEGVPDAPEAWLFRVAKNCALDGLRRRGAVQLEGGELDEWPSSMAAADSAGDEIADDTLRMMFLCAHSSLAPEVRVPLVLKSVCGFGNSEIAAALLAKEGTIAQRLTRGKASLAESNAKFELPSSARLSERLDGVLAVIYLLFNEGYRAHRGKSLMRLDLVHEAVRLCSLLADNEETARPEVHALLALMLLLGARLPARVDSEGELLTLAEQDRKLWDSEWVRAGFAHFKTSISGERVTAYHREAAIASIHASAADYAETDWAAILGQYDQLLALSDDPVVRLNRAVAIAKVEGPSAGLACLDELESESREHSGPLANYLLRHATRALLCWQLGDNERAVRAFTAALRLPCSEPEQRLLRRRLEACGRGESPAAW